MSMPLWLGVVVLGVIEGITEFLPISSTGHLLIAEHWIPRQSDLFNVVIQCGAVIAILPLFPERLKQLFLGWREPEARRYLFKIALAFGITGVGGLVWDKAGRKLPEELAPVAWAVLIGGIGFVAVERWLRGKPLTKEVTWKIAAAVGAAQLIAAIFPGTSRSGGSILFCLLLGLARPEATEFSFLVGIPTMFAAGGWHVIKSIRHPVPGAPSEDWAMVALGCLVSAAVSFLAVKWLLRYIQTHTFTLFGWYRIGLAGVLGLLIWKGL